VSELAGALGNTVGRPGTPSTVDTLLQAVETVEMRFNHRGDIPIKLVGHPIINIDRSLIVATPASIFVFLHPDKVEKFDPNSWTEAQRQRYLEIIKTKQEEFYAAKRTRRLSYDATTYVEVATLIDYPFDCIYVRPEPSSFIATVLCDLAAFTGIPSLYSDIVNDIQASDIVPIYWQPRDTLGQFIVHADDVIHYPTGLEYSDTLTPFEAFQFAEHIKRESQAYRVAGLLGSRSYLALALFLRDRYFPTLWPSLLRSADGKKKAVGG
jgi:hypothetical protein